VSTPFNTWFLRPSPVHSPNHRDRQTALSVCNDRPLLRSTADAAYNKGKSIKRFRFVPSGNLTGVDNAFLATFYVGSSVVPVFTAIFGVLVGADGDRSIARWQS